jgi:hypothetical protein
MKKLLMASMNLEADLFPTPTKAFSDLTAGCAAFL